MKAIVFNNNGKPQDVLSVVEVAKPICKDNEILVRMIKSPINPADVLFIAGEYRYKPQFPQIAGIEGVGIVEKSIFKNVTQGSLVAFRHFNTWAEYVTVPIDKLNILPSDFPIDKAAQFSLNPLTAYALLEESGVKKGDWLVLTSGASAVSKLIIQLSKSKGIKVISIVRNQRDVLSLHEMGVEKVLTIDEDLGKLIPNSIGNDRLQAVIDAVGGEQTTALLKTISPNGRLLLYGLLSKDNVSFHNSDIIFKNITISGFGIDGWLMKQSINKIAAINQELIAEIRKDHVVMPVDSTWEINKVKDAFNRMKQNNVDGKVLLSF